MASRRAKRRKQCAMKKQYCNYEHAEHEACKRRHRTGDDIRPYECPNCGWHHIGHRSAKKILMT